MSYVNPLFRLPLGYRKSCEPPSPECQIDGKLEVIYCVGGVLSPLLANIYLHWFDHLFQRADGPGQWAKARLVRYADDFVVLARYNSAQLRGWIEGKLEGWLGLQINREKTRLLDLRQPGQSLDFLGYTFRYDRDQYDRGTRRYLNLQPSRKAMAREREALRQLINPQQCHTPLPELIGRVN